MKTSTNTLISISIAMFLTACAQSEFSGGGKSGKKSPASGGGGGDEQNPSVEGSGDPNSANLETDGGCVEKASTILSTASLNGKYLHNVFFKNVAVDPGSTGNFKERSFGFQSYPLSPNDTLSNEKIPVSPKLIVDQGPNAEFEFLAFAHQFNNGLDTCSIDFKTIDTTFNAVNSPDVFSAYCYLYIRNLRKEGDKIYGDVALDSISYSKTSTDPFLVRIRTADPRTGGAQDGTGLLKSALSADVVPRFKKQNVDLTNLELHVKLGANSYDSVQYRAARAQIWSDKADPLPECK